MKAPFFPLSLWSSALAMALLCLAPLSSLAQAPAPSSASDASPSTKKNDPESRWPIRFTLSNASHLEEGSDDSDKDEEGFVYETENFYFISPVALEKKAQERLARVFECSLAANMALSDLLPIRRMHQRANQDEKEKAERIAAEKEGKKFKSKKKKLGGQLYLTHKDYLQAGGRDGSNGLYVHKAYHIKNEDGLIDDRVLLPLESLGIDKDGSLMAKEVETHVLVHEITHQCFVLNDLPTWVDEGLADYVAGISTKGSNLNFSTCPKDITARSKNFPVSKCPFTLEEMFNMNQQEFYKFIGTDVYIYNISAGIISYFLDMNGKAGRARLCAYLDAILEGASTKEAAELLLDKKKKQTFEQLEADIEKKLKKLKVNVEFGAE